MLAGETVWCLKCGCYGGDRARGLADICRGKPMDKSGGGLAGQLNCLMKGLHQKLASRCRNPLTRMVASSSQAAYRWRKRWKTASVLCSPLFPLEGTVVAVRPVSAARRRSRSSRTSLSEFATATGRRPRRKGHFFHPCGGCEGSRPSVVSKVGRLQCGRSRSVRSTSTSIGPEYFQQLVGLGCF